MRKHPALSPLFGTTGKANKRVKRVNAQALADYRGHLISWEEYAQQVDSYGTLVGLPADGEAFVKHMRDWLHTRIAQTDAEFPSNEYLSFEKGELILHPQEKRVDPEGLSLLEQIVAEAVHGDIRWNQIVLRSSCAWS